MKTKFKRFIILTTMFLSGLNMSFDCPGSSEEYDYSFWANPYDCTSFYICDNGTAYLEYCLTDLMYNPEDAVCDYPGDFCTEEDLSTPRRPCDLGGGCGDRTCSYTIYSSGGFTTYSVSAPVGSFACCWSAPINGAQGGGIYSDLICPYY